MEFNLTAFKSQLVEAPQPIYFFYGEEEYLISVALESLEAQFLTDSGRDFNYDVFYGKEKPTSSILDVVETLPMMSTHRLVVVKGVDKWNESDWSVFDEYIEDPLASTVLVFVAKAIDRRKKIYKRLLKQANCVEFKKLYDNQVAPWVSYMVERLGISIDRDSAVLLHQLVGNNLSDLQSEVLKLSQYIGDKKHISVKDVIEVVSKIKVQSVFDLSRAIGENDKAKALLCLSHLLSHGQNEVGILALVGRHIRILRSVKLAKRDGTSGPKLASRVGVSPFFLKEYEQQAGRWTDSKIEKTFKALLDTDRALKSSPLSSHIWLENFILQTCS